MGNEVELAIVFADVVGSTKLYELLGDLRARDMVGICIDVMRTATVRALVNTKVLSIARQDFRMLVQHLPGLRATVSETSRVAVASIERDA